MKKNILPLLILFSSLAASAQWSSMTIINHSACDYNVRLTV